MNTHNRALEYLLTKGYSLIPLNNKNRKPLLAWKEYQERQPSESELDVWFNNSDNGIGVVTGKVSQITVVDIDVKNAEGHMAPEDFPSTYTVQTRSGGWHLYYNYYPDIKNSANQWEGLPGVDIRNDGGFVVAPPTEGYTVVNDQPIADFPANLFTKRKGGTKGKYELGSGAGMGVGGRNDDLTRNIGQLLRSIPEAQWDTLAWKTVLAINSQYNPPLAEEEVKRTFESIASKEKTRRDAEEKMTLGAVLSPIQVEDDERAVMKLRANKSGTPYKDTLNAMIALAVHPDWCQAFQYDEFKKTLLIHGEPMKDHHVIDVQAWLQGEMGLVGIAKSVVADAIEKRAHICAFDSAKQWLKGLTWDGVPRVDDWLVRVYGVEDDLYHRGVGSNWLRAMVRRQVYPGSKFDHVLVIRGGQGVRKTTSIAALGKDWHVETTVRADDKDFLMQFDGKAIVEFSEGGTLSLSDTKSLKAIITRTVDKYRAPYARYIEEHPRRCVFCMTTNETQYLKDETGNRRWWVVNMPEGVDADVEWIEENREQLFAEAYARRDEPWAEVPKEQAEEYQNSSRIIKDIEERVVRWYLGLGEEKREDGVTVRDFFEHMYVGDEERMPKVIPWDVENGVKGAFTSGLHLAYTRRRVEGERVRRWFMSDRTRGLPFRPTVF